MSREFEFYDDRSGLNISFEKAVASNEDRCSKPYTLTRELVNTSVHVLGDYGAVQIGIHDFIIDGEKVETAKFITVWEKTDDSWIVKRAISYDHEPASKSISNKMNFSRSRSNYTLDLSKQITKRPYNFFQATEQLN
jgi:hypothetical protein